jgi:hypothetical protein
LPTGNSCRNRSGGEEIALTTVRAIPYLVPYGAWFVGFSEISFSLALLRMASSVRPSFSPMTRVGVFLAAS